MAHSTQIDVDVPLRSLHPDQPSASPRTPFQRQNSYIRPSSRYHHVPPQDQDIAEVDDSGYEYERTRAAHGLGLSNVPQNFGASILKRAPVASTSALSPELPDPYARSSEPLSQASTAQNTGQLGPEGKNTRWATPQSSSYSLQDSPYKHTSDTAQLLNHDHNHGPEGCPTQGDVLKQEWSWFTIMIIAFAIFSWVFSGIFLGIALARPRYGHRIGTRGAMSYDSATLLSALLSKLVELTFATTFVAVLGQILSRRAFASRTTSPKKQGISIAETNMRLWIMQPGTLVTHWTGAKYVITTLLGIVALAAAFAAAFYTTAAEALVSPKLKFGNNQTLRMYGEVSASYANDKWLEAHCRNPMSDPDFGGTTCLQIDFAGNGFRNLYSWMSAWTERQSLSLTTTEIESVGRPPPTAILYDNTTIHGQWIRRAPNSITTDSAKYGRLVQNATIVMPHTNVFHAARVPQNRLLQPGDLQGLGEYYLKAAVPAPGITALCVGAQEEEILPLVGNVSSDGSGVPPPNYPNISTPLDDFFGWSQDPDFTTTYAHPWFGKLPMEFNTVGNTTEEHYGLPWVYLIAKPASSITTNDYVICGIRSFLFSNCSTSVHVSSFGSDMSVHCNNDTLNWKAYANTTNKTEKALPDVVAAPDWLYVGVQWLRSVALTTGITDGNASAARLLTQMVPSFQLGMDTKLDPMLPSLAEALCVLSSYTLLLSTDVAPFVHYWDYPKVGDVFGVLSAPDLKTFQAILSYKDFASGGDQSWKGVFYLILIAVFALNSFCLVMLLYYFCLYGEVTDYTEPQNLFALAINSPPSQLLAGACGGGPSGDMLNKKWCVDMTQPTNAPATPNHSTAYTGATPQPDTTRNSTHPHFFVRYPEEEPLLASGTGSIASPNRNRFSDAISPVLNKRKSAMSMLRPKSVNEFDMGKSPAVQQYMKLTNR